MIPTKPTTNPLKIARLLVSPNLSVRRAANALAIHYTTLSLYETEGYDPTQLSEATLAKMEGLYGRTRGELLDRTLLPDPSAERLAGRRPTPSSDQAA